MTRRLLILLSVAIIALVSAAFVTLNPAPLVLELGFLRWQAPAGQVATLLFVAGWLLGLLSASLWAARLGTERSRLKRSLSLAEAELRTLRAITPVDGR